MSALLFSEKDKHDILPYEQSRIIEQAKFTYSFVNKVEHQRIKQVEVLKASTSEENKPGTKPIEVIFPRNMRIY